MGTQYNLMGTPVGASGEVAPELPPSPVPEMTAPQPKGMSKGLLGAIIAIVIVVALILALLLTGVIPGLKTSSGGGTTGTSYDITFTETGLTAGTTWSITLGGSTHTSTGTSVVFSETNGSYSFTVGTVTGYTPSPSSGTVVVNGAAKTVTITYTVAAPGTYSVTFMESGLASGASWSVTLNLTTMTSTGATIVFSEKNGSYSYTVGPVTGYTASPSSGSVPVAGAAQSVTITFTAVTPGTYPVTFTESGLPSGTSWTVTLASTPMSSTGPTITFTKSNGTYSYTVTNVSGYTVSPLSGMVPVMGAPVSVSITFTSSSGLKGPGYPVTFHQTGLPSTDLWTAYCVYSGGSYPLAFGVTSAGPNIEYAVPDGTFGWSVSPTIPGYVAVPAFGTLTVAGLPVTISITFEKTYFVNFTESGLPNGTAWTIHLNGTFGLGFAPGNVSFQMPNGSYAFTAAETGYSASPASGTVTVSGASVVKPIVFTAVTTYAVTFTESGLAAGTFWEILFNGSFNYTFAPASIGFRVPSGTYGFTVIVFGYTASPQSGNVTVSGGPATQAISFTKITTYPVTFVESGLAAGTSWTVDFASMFNISTAPGTNVFHAPNGTASFTAFASGYTASPATANITVSGAPVTQDVAFTAIVTHQVSFVETGLPSFSFWSVSMQANGAPVLGASGNTCMNSTIGGTELNCSVVNGYYTWIATTITPNFTASPMSGGLWVTGSPLMESITFVNSSADYLVQFSENWYSFTGYGGIPNGMTWSATIGGVTQTTEGMSLFFLEPNGSTAAYSITPPAGYLAVPSSGNVTGYSNPGQSAFYSTTSPLVSLVFTLDPPTPALAALVVGDSPGLETTWILQGVTRDR